MKTLGRVLQALLGLALLAGIIVLGVSYRRQGARFAEAQQAEEAVREQFNAALEAIAEVQDSLTAIAPAEARLLELSRAAEMGGRVTQTQKERMLGTIADLKASIRSTGQRVRELERDLGGSREEAAGLRKVIDGLKRSVTEKESRIRHLAGVVDSLIMKVADLRADVVRGEQTIATQQRTIEEKTREIATVHYIVATKQELKERGIVIERGGLLGIGKSVQLSGSFAAEGFRPLDTDRQTVIAIAGKKPQVLSAQDRSSYALKPDNGSMALHILDAREFRRVQYVVIMVE